MVVREVGEEEVAVLTTEVDEDEEAIEKKKKDVCHNGSNTMKNHIYKIFSSLAFTRFWLFPLYESLLQIQIVSTVSYTIWIYL